MEHLSDVVRLDPVTVLQIDLLSAIFALLPVDSRLRCREVSRSWRAFLADARLWRRLDLSARAGMAHCSLGLLTAALAASAGQLAELDVSGWRQLDRDWLLELVQSCGVSLRALSALGCSRADDGGLITSGDVQALLAAAPSLMTLRCDVFCSEAGEAMAMLSNAPPYSALRLDSIELWCREQWTYDVPALAAAAGSHAGLAGLSLRRARLGSDDSALRAVVDLACAGLRRLQLDDCHLSPANLPALTRLLAPCSRLRRLEVEGDGGELLAGEAVAPFCAALRASRLTALVLDNVRLWHSLGDGLALLAACCGHGTLRALSLKWAEAAPPEAKQAVGEALAALLRPPSRLRALNVRSCRLGDGLRPLFCALAERGARLRELDASYNAISPACAAEAVLPAVRANASLRALLLANGAEYQPALAEAMELVRARGDGERPAGDEGDEEP